MEAEQILQSSWKQAKVFCLFVSWYSYRVYEYASPWHPPGQGGITLEPDLLNRCQRAIWTATECQDTMVTNEFWLFFLVSVCFMILPLADLHSIGFLTLKLKLVSWLLLSDTTNPQGLIWRPCLTCSCWVNMLERWLRLHHGWIDLFLKFFRYIDK